MGRTPAMTFRDAAPWLLGAGVLLAVLVFFFVRSSSLSREPVTVSLPPSGGGAAPVDRTLDIVTLLPRDAIPAIFDPEFVSATEGDAQLAEDDLVIGVSIGGDARAYGVAFLSGHEIVNDVVAGRPIAVTW